MKIIRKTSVSVTTERKFFVRGSLLTESVRCGQCAAEMILAQTSAEVFDVSSREIYRLIEAGKIHFTETPTKNMYVCAASLGAALAAKGEKEIAANDG